jgi:hypothetical protein
LQLRLSQLNRLFSEKPRRWTGGGSGRFQRVGRPRGLPIESSRLQRPKAVFVDRYWRDACPSCSIYQTTFPTHARSANNSGWTNAADQTTDYPDGMRWQASTWFRDGPLPDYVTTLDVTSAFGDPARPGVWRTSDWTGALAQPVSHGENHAVVTGTIPPTIGDDLVVEPGAPGLEVKTIYEVSGSGPWRVSLVAPLAKDHAADARVALAYTSDGTHPSSTLHKAGAAIIESYKANGTLP